MNMLEIAEELQAYLSTHEGNRRTCDAIEESIQLLSRELPEEQRQSEIKRLGDMISFLLEKEEELDRKTAVDTQAKQQLSDKLKHMLEESCEECRSMAERKSMEQFALVEGFEDDFRTKMNVQLNGKLMEEQEKLLRLVRDGQKSLARSVRSVVKEFTESIMKEMEFCMEKVRKEFAETRVTDCRTSYQEIDRTVMSNYDVMQKNITAKADNYKYPAEKFEEFARNAGEQMEKIARREHRFTMFLKLLPALFYLIKYIYDNYLFPKETWFDKLVNLLAEWLEKVAQESTDDGFVKVLGMVVQFVQEYGGVVALTIEFLSLFFFVGWLYYIYVKIVANVRKKSLYRKQQAVMQPAVENFLKELDVKGEIKNILVETEEQVVESYVQKHRLLFEKLLDPIAQETEKGTLQRLQSAYLECIGNGGL